MAELFSSSLRFSGTASPEICESEMLQFPNGVSIVVEGILHSPEYFAAHRKELARKISQGDFVIMEYGPMEGSEFYDELLKETWVQKKNVLSVDPQNLNNDILESIFIGIPLGLAAKDIRNRNVSRRTILKSLLGGVLALPAIDLYTEIFWPLDNPCSTPAPLDTPISFLNFRNGGAIVGLQTAAEQKIVRGRGTFFVGQGHVNPYLTLAGNIEHAREIYEHKLRSLPPEGSAFGPKPVSLWVPGKRQNEWTLVKEIARK